MTQLRRRGRRTAAARAARRRRRRTPTCCRVDRNVAPADDALPLGLDGRATSRSSSAARCVVLRQEEHRRRRTRPAAADPPGRRHGRTRRGAEQDPGAVAGVGVGAGGAAMREVRERGERSHDGLVRGLAVEPRDERDAAGVVLVGRVVEPGPPTRGQRREARARRAVNAQRRPPSGKRIALESKASPEVVGRGRRTPPALLGPSSPLAHAAPPRVAPGAAPAAGARPFHIRRARGCRTRGTPTCRARRCPGRHARPRRRCGCRSSS